VTSTSARAEQIAAFYARHADRLQRIVAAHVNAPAHTIEDACQNAWAILVRRDDITLDDRGASWLATVAICEGWRLSSGGRDVPMGAMRPGVPEEGELPEPEAT
jgi:DNA-directed RNA polymerase specialized sigma24 family protein